MSVFDVPKLLVYLVVPNFECLHAVEILSLIIRFNMFSDRFCCLLCCIVKMMFSVEMVNNKVVGNFFIYLVLKFQVNRQKGLGVIDV